MQQCSIYFVYNNYAHSHIQFCLYNIQYIIVYFTYLLGWSMHAFNELCDKQKQRWFCTRWWLGEQAQTGDNKPVAARPRIWCGKDVDQHRGE